MDYSKQQLRVAEMEQINPCVRRYRLTTAQPGGKLAGFLPGQYINLFYEIDGATASRPYSIASSPKEAESGYYDLYIHGGGDFTSAWLFQNIGVGDTLTGSLPIGEFCIGPQSAKHIIGISGGMSITPLRSMAHAIAEGSVTAELTLFCGWDAPEDVLFFEEFQALQQQCERFHVLYAVSSRPAVGMEHGFITGDLVKAHAEVQDAEFFLCGPREMYDSLGAQFESLHIPVEKYHQELPGEIKRLSESCRNLAADGEPFLITVQRNGTVSCIEANREETVLIAMERAGLCPEARCRSGKCGFCRSKLLRGTIHVDEERDTRNPQEKEQGLFHPCCSFPLSDLTIELYA